MDFDIKVSNRKRMKSDCKWMLCFIGILFFLCVGMVTRQVFHYYSLKGELTKAEERLDLLKKKRQKLLEEKAALGRLEYVEKVARDNYNMVKKNEVPVFIVEEKDK